MTRSAEVRLVPLPPRRGLALVPFPTVDAALAPCRTLLSSLPSAVELMDRELLDPAEPSRGGGGSDLGAVIDRRGRG